MFHWRVDGADLRQPGVRVERVGSKSGHVCGVRSELAMAEVFRITLGDGTRGSARECVERVYGRVGALWRIPDDRGETVLYEVIVWQGRGTGRGVYRYVVPRANGAKGGHVQGTMVRIPTRAGRAAWSEPLSERHREWLADRPERLERALDVRALSRYLVPVRGTGVSGGEEVEERDQYVSACTLEVSPECPDERLRGLRLRVRSRGYTTCIDEVAPDPGDYGRRASVARGVLRWLHEECGEPGGRGPRPLVVRMAGSPDPYTMSGRMRRAVMDRLGTEWVGVRGYTARVTRDGRTVTYGSLVARLLASSDARSLEGEGRYIYMGVAVRWDDESGELLSCQETGEVELDEGRSLPKRLRVVGYVPDRRVPDGRVPSAPPATVSDDVSDEGDSAGSWDGVESVPISEEEILSMIRSAGLPKTDGSDDALLDGLM